ncbi:hypothetical protein BDF22DRAFT_471128 [Syncephalis plumigaleata]|nr:hypothetical protein BDF22DRAFT_471128 [Syncephalis plumigaleata]
MLSNAKLFVTIVATAVSLASMVQSMPNKVDSLDKYLKQSALQEAINFKLEKVLFNEKIGFAAIGVPYNSGVPPTTGNQIICGNDNNKYAPFQIVKYIAGKGNDIPSPQIKGHFPDVKYLFSHGGFTCYMTTWQCSSSVADSKRNYDRSDEERKLAGQVIDVSRYMLLRKWFIQGALKKGKYIIHVVSLSFFFLHRLTYLLDKACDNNGLLKYTDLSDVISNDFSELPSSIFTNRKGKVTEINNKFFSILAGIADKGTITVPVVKMYMERYSDLFITPKGEADIPPDYQAPSSNMPALLVQGNHGQPGFGTLPAYRP